MTTARSFRLRFEPLESRLAPAAFAGNVLTYRDVDGDTVTVLLSKALPAGTTPSGVFLFDDGDVDGTIDQPQQLERIDLTEFPTGIGVTVKAVTASKKASTVDIGWIDGTGVTLGNIIVAGDLGRVTAGIGNSKINGLGTLDVKSLGLRGLATQGDAGDLISDIDGGLLALKVAGDVHGASVMATRIGSVAIGGVLRGLGDTTGRIEAVGDIGTIMIGNVEGGGMDSASVVAGGNLGNITIKGSVIGGAGDGSATFTATKGNIGAVRVMGDVMGVGDGSASFKATGDVDIIIPPDPNPYDYIYPAEIYKWVGGRIASVTIDGSLIGGGDDSASITADVAGSIGPVIVRGNLTGGTGTGSAAIRADASIFEVDMTGAKKIFGGTVASLLVGKAMTGNADNSAAVHAGVSLGNVTLGSLTGGAGTGSGSFFSGGNIGAVSIVGYNVPGIDAKGKPIQVPVAGDWKGGAGDDSGAVITEAGNIGAVLVKGDLTGGDGDGSGSLRATGEVQETVVYPPFNPNIPEPPPPKYYYKRVGGTIASVRVNGSILGGAGTDSASILGLGTGDVGPVTVGKNLTGGTGLFSASIRAEVSVTEPQDPNPDDLVVPPNLIYGGTTGAITINGSVRGGEAGSASIFGDRTVGAVTVKGNWTAASIAAGYRAIDYLDPATAEPVFVGTITSIRINGAVSGTEADETDQFAFLASWIKSTMIGGKAVTLIAGKANDTVEKPLGAFGDFVLVEQLAEL